MMSSRPHKVDLSIKTATQGIELRRSLTIAIFLEVVFKPKTRQLLRRSEIDAFKSHVDSRLTMAGQEKVVSKYLCE